MRKALSWARDLQSELKAQHRVSISSELFWRIYRDEKGAAGVDIPVDAEFAQYECDAKLFFDGDTWPVWFTDSRRTTFVDYKSPGATPIRFRELLRCPVLRDLKLHERKVSGRVRKVPHVVVERCIGCGVQVVIDGCKGLFAIAHEGTNVPLRVTEVFGRDWCRACFDITRICRCRKGS